MSLPDEQLATWAGEHVPGDARWHRLPGATTAAVWVVSSNQDSWVVKAYTNESFVSVYPDCVDHAVAAMRHVATHGDLRVPQVVGADATGEQAGSPTIIMTELIGSPLLPTRRVFDRIIDVAEQIHDVPAGDFPWRHRRYNEPGDVFAPDWFGDSSLFNALAAMSGSAQGERVFIHRDFHHANMLFDGDAVVGIIDWDYACVGPPGEDYGRVWLNLAASYGQRISDVFAARAARRLEPSWAAATWLDWLPFYEGEQAVAGWGSAAERQQVEAIGRWVTELA